MTKNLSLNSIFLILIVSITSIGIFSIEAYGISYSYEKPPSKILAIDVPYTIKLIVGDHKGLDSIEQALIKIKINDFQNTTSISLKWTQIDGQQLVSFDDNEFVTDVSVDALNRGFLEFQFEFIPIKEIRIISVSVDVLEHAINDVKVHGELESNNVIDQNNEKENTSLKNTKDRITKHGIGRNTSLFDSYMQGQQVIAKEIFNNLVGNKNIQNQNFGENHNSPINDTRLSRGEDIELQNSILEEMKKAEELFEKLFHFKYNFDKKS